MDNSEQKGLLEDLILEMMEANQNSVTIEKKLTLSNDYLNNVNANTWATFEQLHVIAEIMSATKDFIGNIDANSLEVINRLGTIAGLAEDSYKTQLNALAEQAEGNRKMLSAMETARRAQAEADYESKRAAPSKPIEKETKKARDIDFKFGSFGDLIQGILVGFYRQIATTGKGILRFATHFGKWFGNLFRSIRGTIDSESLLGKLITRVQKIWRGITAPFRAVTGALGEVWNVVKFIGGGFVDLGKGLWNIFKRITGLGAVIEDFKGVFSYVKAGFTNIVTKVQKFFGLSGGGKGLFSLLGHGIGRLFGVFGWVLTIWDTINGIIDGYKQDGVFGAVKGAIKGFFKAWADLGDMILGAVAWVARLFGAEDFAKKLEGFSLSALLTNTVDAVFGWFKLIFKDPGEALSQLWNNLVGEGGFLDLLWKPINMLVDWVSKKFGWRDENAPEFSIGGILRNIWNGIVEAIATWMDDYTLLKPFSGKIRAMKAGKATVDVSKMATPEKTVTQTGDTLKQAASDKKDTEVAGEVVRDMGAMNAASAPVATPSAPSNVNANTSISTVNISNGSLPDRTDWSIMSGSFGLAP